MHFGEELVKELDYSMGIDHAKSYSNTIYKYFKGAKLLLVSICDNFVKKWNYRLSNGK